MTISQEILHKIENLTPKQQLELEIYLSKLENENPSSNKNKKPKAGFLKGKIKMLDGFDDPLEEFADYI